MIVPMIDQALAQARLLIGADPQQGGVRPPERAKYEDRGRSFSRVPAREWRRLLNEALPRVGLVLVTESEALTGGDLTVTFSLTHVGCGDVRSLTRVEPLPPAKSRSMGKQWAHTRAVNAVARTLLWQWDDEDEAADDAEDDAEKVQREDRRAGRGAQEPHQEKRKREREIRRATSGLAAVVTGQAGRTPAIELGQAEQEQEEQRAAEAERAADERAAASPSAPVADPDWLDEEREQVKHLLEDRLQRELERTRDQIQTRESATDGAASPAAGSLPAAAPKVDADSLSSETSTTAPDAVSGAAPLTQGVLAASPPSGSLPGGASSDDDSTDAGPSPSLTEVLAARGLTHRRSCKGEHLNTGKRDVLRGDEVVMEHVSSGDVWEWLRDLEDSDEDPLSESKLADALMPDVQGPDEDEGQEDEEQACDSAVHDCGPCGPGCMLVRCAGCAVMIDPRDGEERCASCRDDCPTCDHSPCVCEDEEPEHRCRTPRPLTPRSSRCSGGLCVETPARCAECDAPLAADSTECPDPECPSSERQGTTAEALEALVGDDEDGAEPDGWCGRVGPDRVVCSSNRKDPVGRSVAPEMHGCDWECPGYWEAPRPDQLWPGERCAPPLCTHTGPLTEPTPEQVAVVSRVAEDVVRARRERAARWLSCVARTARDTRGVCAECGNDVEGGDRYREGVAPAPDGRPVRRRSNKPSGIAHTSCVEQLAQGEDPRAQEETSA